MSELRMRLDERVSPNALSRYSHSSQDHCAVTDNGLHRMGTTSGSDLDLDPTLAAFVDLTRQMLQQHSFSVQVGNMGFSVQGD